SGTDNPLEGPSWLLDLAQSDGPRPNFEPDSTTPCDGASSPPTPIATTTSAHVDEAEKENTPTALAFTPTMRRRKRSSTPPESPRPKGGRHGGSGRVLKVMVAKMRPAEEALAKGEASPPKRPALADARATPHMPSPNGNTHGSLAPEPGLRLGKSEAEEAGEPSYVTVGRSRRTARARPSPSSPSSRAGSRSRSRASSAAASPADSDGSAELGEGDGRTRRARKQVSYKEKSLNRKLRR
ncbi:proteoglycan 4-like, partial [Hyposmocoma kahamanoa]|uniref:proteoglycan 4-like n=1 Tax=Hyposmocoma kahamanoa TaxID=1477025 RepID=UPI000E6D5B26